MTGGGAAVMRPDQRLRASSDFAHVYRTGTRARTPSVVAVFAVDDELPPRVGVTVSRRVGGAVVRNRAKRRLRAAADPLVRRLRLGSRVVLQATPATNGVEFQKLEEDVRVALAKAGALDA